MTIPGEVVSDAQACAMLADEDSRVPAAFTEEGGKGVADDKSDRVGEALERDWEQTKSDLPGLDGKDLDQDVDDTVKQALGDERVPPDGEKNRD
jgi:hypothetical protein